MVSVTEVRRFLGDLPSTLVSDEAIQQQIDFATGYINDIKSSEASSEQVDRAILVYASWLTFLSYAARIERSLGEVPLPVTERLKDLREEVSRALSVVKRSSSAAFLPNLPCEGIDHEYF